MDTHFNLSDGPAAHQVRREIVAERAAAFAEGGIALWETRLLDEAICYLTRFYPSEVVREQIQDELVDDEIPPVSRLEEIVAQQRLITRMAYAEAAMSHLLS